jgi:RHH-type rel operon transcriptional repressor/antitoxin RelB
MVLTMAQAAAKEAVTIRIEAEKRAAVDSVARALQRDRSFVINAAIDAYLTTHRWHAEHIEEGLRQAEAGEFASEEEVAQAFARWSV